MCGATPVHCEICVFCIYLFFSCCLHAHKTGTEAIRDEHVYNFKSLCSTLQETMRMMGNVSICVNLLGSNVCDSSFLTFSRCHG